MALIYSSFIVYKDYATCNTYILKLLAGEDDHILQKEVSNICCLL